MKEKERPDYTASIKATAERYGDAANDVMDYLLEGQERAFSMPNRGPTRFVGDSLAPDIIESFSEYGFYVFESMVGQPELSELQKDVSELISKFPIDSSSQLDVEGNKAVGVDAKGACFLWSKPLGDPLGGTDMANGRHQVKITELNADVDAPSEAVVIMLGLLQYSEACLRLYANRDVMRIAESICGEDYVPIYESLFIKEPKVGPAISWHQDGTVHWGNDSFSELSHGMNVMVQLYGSTPVNGVWLLPGTHRGATQIDVVDLVRKNGSERLANAVPLVCNPGDVVITNRQILHGSFPNAGFERRVTVNFGIGRLRDVLGVRGAGVHTGDREIYTADRIQERIRIIGYATGARSVYNTAEAQYAYKPLANTPENFTWDDKARSAVRDYNLLDLSI